jgi:UTP--glucose-1-phosphate uridylyltransferase
VLAQMAQKFAEEQCSILGVEEIAREHTASYGIVSTERAGAELSAIKAIVEKPAPAQAPSTLAVVGRYVLTPGVFAKLAAVKPGRGGEIQLTDAISALLAEERVLAYRFSGRRYDCGSKLGYLQATVELGAKHPAVGAEFARYLAGRRNA